jgi:hypothetical protein
VSTRIPNSTPWERLSPSWSTWRSILPPPEELGSRGLGEPVTDRRSSWVRRLATAQGHVFVKTYEYKSWASRFRDFGKRTGPWAAPRTVREFTALAWLRDHGFPGPEPIVALVWRRLGFVRRTTLVTTAWPGRPADDVLASLGPAERREVGDAVGTLVGRLHALGFRDRNLDLRNLLVDRGSDGWNIAKIDSPRFRLRAPGRADDALARADWARLAPQLDAFDIADDARRAAARVRAGTDAP